MPNETSPAETTTQSFVLTFSTAADETPHTAESLAEFLVAMGFEGIQVKEA